MRIPSNSCKFGDMSNKIILNNIVTSIAIEVLYTLTIVSAYFIIQLTRSPVNARLKTTNQVMMLYPRVTTLGHKDIPFEYPTLTSSKNNLKKLMNKGNFRDQTLKRLSVDT